MTQKDIRARNRKEAKELFLGEYSSEEIYDVTKTFHSWKETKPEERVYRVTGKKRR